MQIWYDANMSTERVTITLPADLVAQIDAIAQSRVASRSSIVREASAQYIAATQAQLHEQQLSAATDDLISFLDELQAAPVLEDRPVLEILRELRGGALDAPQTRDPDSRGPARSR